MDADKPLLEMIRYIKDKHTDTTVSKDRYSIQKLAALYSNTKEPIYKLVLDGKAISRNNSYTVRYACQTCSTEQEITLNLFLRKLNRECERCDACKNNCEEKCRRQSEFMKQNIGAIREGSYEAAGGTPKKSASLEQHLENSAADWSNESADFQANYFQRHLTVEEFESIRGRIVSLNHDKFKSIDDWEYQPCYRVYNQTRYTPMLIHKTESLREKPQYLKFRCETCESEFIHRDLEVVKGCQKILCQTCSLTNRTFRLRKKVLKDGTKVLWQSIPERRFIEWCEEHGIRVQNGPNIEYEFQGSKHIYKVDFELPDLKVLVEIKDNHCWHLMRRSVREPHREFHVKEDSAKEWCDANKYQYHLVFPKTFQRTKDLLLRAAASVALNSLQDIV